MAKTSDFHKSETLGYLISKVGRFVEDEMMRNIIGQQRSGFDFRDVMDNQKFFSLTWQKETGEINSKLFRYDCCDETANGRDGARGYAGRKAQGLLPLH